MGKIELRMGKATEQDLDFALVMAGIIDDVFDSRMGCGSNYPRGVDGKYGEDDPSFFDWDNPEHVAAFSDRILHLQGKCSLTRVIFGMQTLLSPENAIVDPDVDYLKLHPRFEADEQFLLARAGSAGAVFLGVDKGRDTGESSNSIVAIAYESLSLDEQVLPSDGGDLAACERMREKLPNYRKTKDAVTAMERARAFETVPGGYHE